MWANFGVRDYNAEFHHFSQILQIYRDLWIFYLCKQSTPKFWRNLQSCYREFRIFISEKTVLEIPQMQPKSFYHEFHIFNLWIQNPPADSTEIRELCDAFNAYSTGLL